MFQNVTYKAYVPQFIGDIMFLVHKHTIKKSQ